jgi:hypothetical protein
MWLYSVAFIFISSLYAVRIIAIFGIFYYYLPYAFECTSYSNSSQILAFQLFVVWQ